MCRAIYSYMGGVATMHSTLGSMTRRARRSTGGTATGWRAAIGAATGALVLWGSALPSSPAQAAEATAFRSAPGNAQTAVSGPRERAKALVAQMTLDEKISMVHGIGFLSGVGFAGKVAGIPRLGIPPLVLADGPNGVGNGATGVTAFPAAINDAASWDTSLVRRYGTALGQEQAGKGNNVALAPTINIMRVPQWGRSFETFSEDPALTGAIGTAEIRGVQSQGVIADAKHFVANNQETDRDRVDEQIGERALREIYLPGFEQAVQRGGVLSAMCAYNQVNGAYMCQNRLINDVLKADFGFRGFVVSDWAATHSAAGSANAGLDLEMPYGPQPAYPQFFGDQLRAAVLAGTVPMARLDDMVTRILTAMISEGLLDHPATGSQSATVTTAEHQQLARTLSEQGTVLLKNARGVLPFMSRAVRSVAVIGAAAQDVPIYTGGGSANVIPSAPTTPLQGIRARAGSTQVTYAPGTAGTAALPDIPTALLTPASGTGHGLTATYYASRDFTGTPVAVRTEPTVDFSGAPPVAGLSGQWSARWTGTFTPPATGTHRFSLVAQGIADLYVNGQHVASSYARDHGIVEHALVELTAGRPVSIRVDYVADFLPRRKPALQVGWLAPNPALTQRAVDAAKASDVAVVFVNDLRTEGQDVRTLALPADQNRLIEAVAAANPRTVVVLNTAGAVLTPWLSRVAGVLEAWYPGQENGNAIAAVLFGDVNPSGRLPITFPASDHQTPVADPQRWPGVNDVATYSEGLLVGYRWWDATGQRPLFPFGYGLSYTTFRHDHLRLSKQCRDVVVRVRVTNTGRRVGADVVQLYVGFPAKSGEPPRQLKAFKKITLAPGRDAQVRFRLSARDFSRWNTRRHAWVSDPGTYRIMVGSSSRDISATGSLKLPRRP
jgi:beta-glucosidase